ncbi:IS3 family transposase [Psychrobacillus sp.]|uniref:IS3 family transposase n=1 Tax=Psychrobacillus sp. TaxID=1871623 RepID=UPI0028BDBC9B|nr:IS3 family transposase [Psychrobacillus sp.]
MPSSKSTSSAGIRTQRSRIPIKRCTRDSKDSRGNVSLPSETTKERRSRQRVERVNRRSFQQHEGRYGYRRVYLELRAQDYVINHKKVQRIMSELGLKCVKFTRKSRYNSYKGTVGKVVKNLLNRRFNRSVPLQKLVTDVTEFKCTKGNKLYLSPMLNLYNSEIITFGISNRPTLDFVMETLNQAVEMIKKEAEYRSTIHSDQGWHYQHKKWMNTLKQNKIFQSMSRKATCADNAAMENFFCILKQEMYYGEELVSYEELKRKIEQYIDYYNNTRIKAKLAGLSPVQYRTQTSQSAAK